MFSAYGKILIVDDEETILFTAKRFLTREGYEVVTANDCNTAFDAISKTAFDVIFSDIILENSSGLDILKEIKKRKLTCPVILITGYPNVETAAEAVRSGAYDYIPKPVKKYNLIHTARMALQHKEIVDKNVKYQSNVEAIFRSVKDTIVTVDKDLLVLEANEAAGNICGFYIRDVRGKKFDSLARGCNNGCLDAVVKTINTMKPVDMRRFACKRKDRPRRIVSVSTFPLLDSQGLSYGCVLVGKDETRLVTLERNLQERQKLHNILGKSDKMQKVYSLIDNIAGIRSNVLITGESGTGKELAAEALHFHKTGSSDKPLVKVNCAALSDNLLESELFGHVKGAFTGAVSNRVGRFQKADGGTIFLDEIGDISEKMQQRLLRVVQEMEFERVGDSNAIKVDVRVIAATNKELRSCVRQGKFREDLYYRLKVIELNMPPLRERRDDIPLLVDHFLEKFNKQFNKNIVDVCENVLKIFMDYTWPGNIRELRHKLEHACILCDQSIITVNDLPADFVDADGNDAYPSEIKKNTECQAIVRALEKSGWNKAKAARMLGVDRKTIYLKIEKYGITENAGLESMLDAGR